MEGFIAGVRFLNSGDLLGFLGFRIHKFTCGSKNLAS